MLESLFNKKIHQHRCFPANIAKFLRTPISKNVCERLLLRSTWYEYWWKYRNSRPEVFLRKYVLKISNKLTGEHPCRSEIAIKLLCSFIEIALRHRCSPVNLLHIFRASFLKSSSVPLLLKVPDKNSWCK